MTEDNSKQVQSRECKRQMGYIADSLAARLDTSRRYPRAISPGHPSPVVYAGQLAAISATVAAGLLGPVNTCMVVATEAIFLQDKAARVPCSHGYTSER